MLTSWHDNTEDLALGSLSPPVGGPNLEDVPFSRCEAIYGGCGGAATVRHTFHSKRLHSRSIRQDVLCVEVEHEQLL